MATVRILRSTTAGSTPSSLSTGQIAINEADGKLFYRSSAGVVTALATGGGGATEVYEYATTANFPATGSAAQLVIATDTGRIYRWAGNAYAELGSVGGILADTRWDLFLPAAPTGVTAAAGNAQATLSWTAPSVTVPLTNYFVQYSSNSGSSWTVFSRSASTATAATVTGLTNGTSYVFRVAAVNGVGTGSYSTASGAITPTSAVFRAIPTLTSNTSNGTAEANTSAGGAAWNLFDGSSTEYYTQRNGSDTPKRYFQYTFAGGLTSLIGGYTMTAIGSYSQAISSWEFSGSNDGSTFTLLDTRSTSWSSGTQVKSFTLASPANYSTYRWTLTPDGANDSFAGLSAVQLTA